MKKIFTLLLLLSSLMGISQSTTIVISQVYGGGGGSTGTYLHDYVELHNVSGTTQSLTGFSLQYGSATGNFASSTTNLYAFPAGTSMPAGSYLLIQLSSPGSVGTALPVTPDLITTNLTMSGASGKVVLAAQATALGCGATPCSIPSSSIIDLVGFGTGVNNAEGGASVNNNVALTATQGAVRKNNGCQDTDNNNNDFNVVTAPIPRNSASPVVSCIAVPASFTITGTVSDFGTVDIGSTSTAQSYNIAGANLTGAPGTIAVAAPSADFQVSNDNNIWGATTSIAYSSATLSATPVWVRFSPQTAGVKNGNVVNSGAGVATAVNVPVSGTGAVPVTPVLLVSNLTAFGSVCLNATGGPNSFTINGISLSTANITVGPLAGYSFSTTATGTYTNSLSITQAGGTLSQTVFVNFTPTASQNYDGNIVVAGAGATAVNVAASGSGANNPAAVTTGTATAVTTNTTTLGGTVSSLGCSALTAYGFYYSTTNGFANGTGTQVSSTNINTGSYTAAVTGLAPSTTYYFKAFVTNAGGTVYGTQQTFNTASPVLVATPLTSFGSICANVTSAANSFAISSTGLGTSNVTVGPLTAYTFSTSATGTFTNSLSITQPGGAFTQTIFVKFTPTATQSYNGNIPVAGGGANSINLAVVGAGVNTPGTATTAAATNITTSSATLAGTITGAGCSATASYGIEYSGINNFVNGSGTKVAGANVLPNGSFTVDAAGLVLNTKYYFRTYVTSASGTGYGNLQTFTTDSIKNELVLYGIPVQRGSSLRFSVNNIKPNHYAVVLFNSNGQQVYRKDMIIQTTYINDAIVVPGTLSPGVYQFQLENVNGYRKRKTILIK